MATAEDGRRQAFGLDDLTPDEYRAGWIRLFWKFVLPKQTEVAVYFSQGCLQALEDASRFTRLVLHGSSTTHAGSPSHGGAQMGEAQWCKLTVFSTKQLCSRNTAPA